MSFPEFPQAEQLPTPCLVLYRDRMMANLERMVAMAGDARRLCPHLKTAKMVEVVQAYRQLGIERFKCATIAEAELAGRAGAEDVLLAYPLVGPNPARWVKLVNHFSQSRWSTLVDSTPGMAALEAAAADSQQPLTVLMDVDVGMHRTGIAPGAAAVELYRRVHESPRLVAGGLHIYDGHIHDLDLGQRTERVRAAMAPAMELRQRLLDAGLPVPRVVVGGSASFPIHRDNPLVECSPGTSVFWDSGYQKMLPEQPFEPAVLLLTRVISHPTTDTVCLDVGYKAVASETPFPRLSVLGGDDPEQLGQSEEHLVVRPHHMARFPVGALVYTVPKHICPTVALHDQVHVVQRSGDRDQYSLAGVWRVAARSRTLEF